MRAGPALVALVLVSATLVAADARASSASVSVTATEFKFALARLRVPVGTVRFDVTNDGVVTHDFAIAGKRTKVLLHGQRAPLVVRFTKAGRYRFLCTIAGHAKLGMTGVLTVGRPRTARPKQPPPAPPPPPASGLALTQIGAFEQPVFIASAPGASAALYVVEQSGTIRTVVNGGVQEQPFLDVSGLVRVEGENGLLSMAFAPDYPTSGRFYVIFNDRSPSKDLELVEFRRSAGDPSVADPMSYRLVLKIEKPYANHNGGMLQFGPGSHLYVSVGDGDSGQLHSPGFFAQSLGDLLGNILRIDPAEQADGSPYGVPDDNPFVGEKGVRPEIWAYGLRNPWRFWIDPPTGDLYVGDVALGGPEELDWLPGGDRGGENFGWPCFEGTVAFDSSTVCDHAVPPVLEYAHDADRCGIIGGVVVRDPRLPELTGRFLYTDLCGGELESVLIAAGKATEQRDLGLDVKLPYSFGVDSLGRVYVVSGAGPLYRLDPAEPGSEQRTPLRPHLG